MHGRQLSPDRKQSRTTLLSVPGYRSHVCIWGFNTYAALPLSHLCCTADKVLEMSSLLCKGRVLMGCIVICDCRKQLWAPKQQHT